MKKEKVVVLVSGGFDSCVTAAIASQSYELAFLHLNYGQRTEKKELECFNLLAEHFKIKEKLIVDVSYLKKIGGSSLTDEKIKVSKFNANQREIPTSYVPFRNANIISIAVSWAEVLGATKIFIGAVEEDSSGYPDCREEFYKAFNEVIKQGTKPATKITIETPVIHKNKGEIALIGKELNAPFHLTWSCYSENEIACGVCDSCVLRLKGFEKAGMTDPIAYKKSAN
ncbi:7-cyano-7-deazaguanine synthase QueC [bacterium]|nr:7-cyano-7-deazaguanine synthase QueC [bacterium]